MPGPSFGRFSAWLSGVSGQTAFLKSVGAVSIIRLAGGGLLFLSQLLLARWMGARSFGIYSYAWAWVAVLGPLAGLGFAATSVRFLATYRVQAADARIRGLLGFGWLLTLASSLIVAACGLAVVHIVAGNSPYGSALQAAFLGIPLLAFLGLDAANARGFNWMALSAVAEQIGRPAALIVFGWLFMKFATDTSALGYVVCCLLAYFIAASAQHLVVRGKIHAVVGSGPSQREIAVWLRVSTGMLLLNGAEMIRMNTDLVLVGTLLGPVDVGVYTAVVRTATLVSFVLNITSIVAQTNLASLYAQKRRTELVRFVASTTRSILLTSLAIGAVLALSGQLILGRFGPGFTAGYPSLLILIAGHILVAGFGPLTSLLLMTGQQVPAATIYGISAVTGAALNFFLIPPFGIAGAAIASGANLLLAQVALAVVVRRRLGIAFAAFGFRPSHYRPHPGPSGE
jgi:O-antigen/teichoic acid export membrane protein